MNKLKGNKIEKSTQIDVGKARLVGFRMTSYINWEKSPTRKSTKS